MINIKKAASVLGFVGAFGIGASQGANCQVDAKTQAEIQAAIALGDCIETTIVSDTQQTPVPSPITIASDCAMNCGATAANLANLFTSSSDPLKRAIARAATNNGATIDGLAARARK